MTAQYERSFSDKIQVPSLGVALSFRCSAGLNRLRDVANGIFYRELLTDPQGSFAHFSQSILVLDEPGDTLDGLLLVKRVK